MGDHKRWRTQKPVYKNITHLVKKNSTELNLVRTSNAEFEQIQDYDGRFTSTAGQVETSWKMWPHATKTRVTCIWLNAPAHNIPSSTDKNCNEKICYHFFCNHLAAILKGRDRSGLINLTSTHHLLNTHSKQYTTWLSTKYHLMLHPHTKLQVPVVHKPSKQHLLHAQNQHF
jgi:hypothetical protein